MDRKKDIGHIFKDRLGKLKDSPREDLWVAIASEIDQSTKRRIAPFWYYIGGVLLVFVISFLLPLQPGAHRTKQQEIRTNPTPLITKSTQNKTTSSSANRNADSKNSTRNTLEKNSNQYIKDSLQNSKVGIYYDNANSLNIIKTQVNSKSKSVVSGSSEAKSHNISPTPIHPNTNINSSSAPTSFVSSITSLVKTNSKKNENIVGQMEDSPREREARAQYEAKIAKELQDAINLQLAENERKYQELLKLETIAATQKEKTQKQEKEAEQLALAITKIQKTTKTNEERTLDRKAATEYKIAISPYTSLLTYGSLSKGSSLDDRLEDNPREAIGTIGYGVKIDYPISEKASIRVGIGVAPLRYRTDNFQVSSVNGTINIFELSALSVPGLNQPGIETSIEAQNFFQENEVVSIEQDISYLEVPVDYQYRLLNKRIGLSFNSGLSLFVLTENSVFATSNSGTSILIGRETDLKELSLAFNLGLGAYYNISKHWRIDAEPAFKYQLNPYIDGNTNFRPYYFGLQLGLSHKF